MKHLICVPDGMLNSESKTPEYLTGVARADTFENAFLVGRAFAQRYGQAFLLMPDSSHIFTGWRKADDTEDRDGLRPVVTGIVIDRHHERVSWQECPECEKVVGSVRLTEATTEEGKR